MDSTVELVAIFRFTFIMGLMFGFQISKWFWHVWDNLLVVILWNLCSLFPLGISFYLFQLLPPETPNLLIVVLPTWSLILLYLTTLLQHAAALNNYNIAKFQHSDWKGAFRLAKSKGSLLAALIFDLLLLFAFLVFWISLRFYSQQGGFVSLLALGLLFWLGFLVAISIGLYFPMLVREEFSVKKALRQSVVVALDNLAFSIALGIVALFLCALSFIPPLVLFFGPVGLGLWYESSLRILFYKYQYLEQLPQEERIDQHNRRKKMDIPWRILLREEREKIGPRSLRNFIFPWKD